MLMTNGVARISVILLMTLTALNAQSVNPAVTVPRTVRYTGSFHPADGLAVQPMEGVTMAVYADQTGGDPLWQETQNVQVDVAGNFAVEMGATQNEGLPLDLLRTGEPRWVGMRVNRPAEAEQPRVRLLSVPYALRASDAETLGGIPASAYLLNPSASVAGSKSSEATVAAPASTNAVKPRVTSGTTNFIGVFTNSTDLGNSVMFQNAGKIGLNTVNPLDYFHVVFNDTSGGFTGYAVQNLGSGAASYSGTLFYDQNGALGQFQGFNNSTHEYRINNIASGGSINFMLGSASKFQVQPTGDINIAGSIRKGGTLFLHNLGTQNTAIGLNALQFNTTGNNNSATGASALFANTTGSGNTASGSGALLDNTTGSFNTASGFLALQFNTTGGGNTANGWQALQNNTTGLNNTASGAGALQNNTSGGANTANGSNALQNNTTGSSNTAVGVGALLTNTTGVGNTANGAGALFSNTVGVNDSASGFQALYSNSTGNSNTAMGANALQSNTTGSFNTASGYQALFSNTIGISNTASGEGALENNTTGNFNTADGTGSLVNNTSGDGNAGFGGSALSQNTTGVDNTAIGNGSLVSNTTGGFNTGIGGLVLQSSTTGSFNNALGYLAGGNLTTGGNNIMIANQGTSSDDHTIRVGDVQTKTFIAGIRGKTTGTSDAVTVVIDSNGQLGTVNSSRRFKEDIQDMGDASSNLLHLRPVTYRYKKPYADGSKPLDYGLIAEEVADVYPDLVVKNKDEQVETVQYQKLTPMLLNELQKQNQHVQQQDETIRHQQERIGSLEGRLAALEAQLSGSATSATGR